MSAPSHNSTHGADAWDTELFVLRGEDHHDLAARIEALLQSLEESRQVDLKAWAASLSAALPDGGVRLAVVASSADDLQAKLKRAAQKLADPQCDKIRDVTGIYYAADPLGPQGKIAFVFPGEGAQYLNMIGGLASHFPAVEAVLAYCDEIAARPGSKVPSPRRFIEIPRDATPEERQAAETELRRLGNAMFSVLAADLALFHLLCEFGLTPDMIGGHSAGELAALVAAGCIYDEHGATERVVQTMQALEDMEEETDLEPAVLLAVGASCEKMATLLEGVQDAFVAMDNCPHQAVLVGRAAPMAVIEARLQKEGYMYERLTLSRPYHTRLFEPYSAPLAEMLEEMPFQSPEHRLYSCTTAQPFPNDPAEIRRLTLAHWFSRVEFTQMIRNMYDDGARLFVEVGPRGNLTSFIEDILRGQSFLATPLDTPRRSAITQLQHALGQLAAHGVPLRLEAMYAPTDAENDDAFSLSSVEDNHQDLAPEPSRLQPAASLAATYSSASAVVASHLALMDQFLGDQQFVMQQYLTARRLGLRPVRRSPRLARLYGERRVPEALHFGPDEADWLHTQSENDDWQPPSPPLPMVGQIIRFEPGQEVVMRRQLDLAEDRFAADHTVGGRVISKVHSNHYGLPISPMTFTLELMAETATLLAPDRVAVQIKDVRLLRWLAYYEDAPGEIEAAAKIVNHHPHGEVEVEVRVTVLDNGNLPPGETGGLAAVGRVVLTSAYPEPPTMGEFPLSNRRPCSISLERLYGDLFHGPLLMGITELYDVGDEGIEGRAVVLPRKGLFRSIDDPQFVMDPVLLDVVMHPLCAWHLEQPDLAGRTLLPFELQSVTVYGPRPAEGAQFMVHGRMKESSPRHFVHAIEAFDDQGRMWCSLTVKYWRFYMPFGDVNFHGRKDEYFLSRPWPEALPTTPGHTSQDQQGEPRGICIRLEPPVDLHQPAMQMVTAKVTLSADEMRQYRSLNVPPKKRFDWVFGRLAAKDAVRLMWWKRHGERFFPADLEIQHDEFGRPVARHLGYHDTVEMPNVSVSHADGVMAALASYEPYVGIDLEKIEPREESFEAVAFDDFERTLLAAAPDRFEAATRFWCAKEAVAKALGRGLNFGPHSVTVRACYESSAVTDSEQVVGQAALEENASSSQTQSSNSWWLEVELGPGLAAEFPHFAGRRLRVFTTGYKKFIVATTFCDIVQ